MTILVTGGTGFIGSNFVLEWLDQSDERLVNVDLLTYAANPLSLASVCDHPRYSFVQGDIADKPLLRKAFTDFRPRAVINFAAESHVDRSILDAQSFLNSNVEGTLALLEVARSYWDELESRNREKFRFLQVSTDEVYGTLMPGDPAFTEEHPFAPNSPYAASKAAGDMFVRAMFHTFGLPVLTTHCSNNYGPRQFPEKLIPLMILNALEGKPLPVYGDGQNIRDWLHVADHCSAIRMVLECGILGERYNVGGNNEIANIDLVRQICTTLDTIRPDPAGPRERLIAFVKDRPGHDFRYAIDNSRIEAELGWKPSIGAEEGLKRTIGWYLENPDWIASAQTGSYRDWMQQHYVREGRMA